jgi:hypothetical protein
VKTRALVGVHALGAFYKPPLSTSPHDTAILQHALRTSVASGARVALTFAIVVVAIGALLSFLIPRVSVSPTRAADPLEPLEPLDVDPALSTQLL